MTGCEGTEGNCINKLLLMVLIGFEQPHHQTGNTDMFFKMISKVANVEDIKAAIPSALVLGTGSWHQTHPPVLSPVVMGGISVHDQH